MGRVAGIMAPAFREASQRLSGHVIFQARVSNGNVGVPVLMIPTYSVPLTFLGLNTLVLVKTFVFSGHADINVVRMELKRVIV